VLHRDSDIPPHGGHSGVVELGTPQVRRAQPHIKSVCAMKYGNLPGTPTRGDSSGCKLQKQ
jgi:hypothetical protein